jgi:hypothetical protein
MDLRDKLSWFRDNLRLQLEDERDAAAGSVFRTYFDTSDVRGIALGLQKFFDLGQGFDLSTFRQRVVLVHALAAGGWLKRFEMLPPHQSEFLSLLQVDFGFPREMNWAARDRADEFLGILGINDQMATLRSLFAEVDSSARSFKRGSLSAELLFKAIQCVKGGAWNVRLAKLRKEDLLYIEPYTRDYAEVVGASYFWDLKHAFDRRREGKPLNNFADAVALSILIIQVREFASGESRELPLFFDSTGIFREVMRETEVVARESEMAVEIRKINRVLRGADYFIFRSMFRPPQDLPNADRASILSDVTEIKSIVEKMDEILETKLTLRVEDINGVLLAGRPLAKVVDEFRDLSFLENVWLPFCGERDLKVVLAELEDLAQQAKGDEFRERLETAIGETKAAFEKNVDEYRSVRALWVELEKRYGHIKNRVGDKRSTVEVFRDFGLIRFSFPAVTHDRIEATVEFLISGDSRLERDACLTVVSAFYQGKSDRSRIEDLALASAILWVAGMDDYLIRLLLPEWKIAHHSLKCMLAAASLRGRREGHLGLEIIAYLEHSLSETTEAHERGELAIDLAYLCYHYWISQGGKISWREREGIKGLDGLRDRFVQSALTYAQEAMGAFESDDPRAAYSLNQYLYYMIEGAGDERMEEMRITAEELLSYLDNRVIWQYRFDDTLARYFHRLATQATDERQWRDLMAEARHRIDEAWAEAQGDEVVDKYRTHLMMELAAGYRRHRDGNRSTGKGA